MARLFILLLVFSLAAVARQNTSSLEHEMQRVDSLVADPNTKLAVVDAIADDLGVHPNRLLLLRRQTGKTFAEIYVSSLEEQHLQQDGILVRLRGVCEKTERKFREGWEPGSSAIPILFIGTSVDHSSVGTLFATAPEAGIEFRHGYVTAGVPYYKGLGGQFSSGGIGDAHLTGSVYGILHGVELASALTVGAPTGDSSRGFGAGKTTLNLTGTVTGRLGNIRPFLTAGLANSVFNNIGYQRSYISDGNAGLFSGGIELSAGRRLQAGAGAFAVRPFGEQTIRGSVGMDSVSPSTGTLPPRAVWAGPGAVAPGMGSLPGAGSGDSGMHTGGLGTSVAVTPDELRDHGVNAWVSIALHPAVALNLGVARSVPLHLTTARFGLGFNLSRILFPRRHF